MAARTLHATLAAAGLGLAMTAHGGPPKTYPNFKDQPTSQFIIAGNFGKGTSLRLPRHQVHLHGRALKPRRLSIQTLVFCAKIAPSASFARGRQKLFMTTRTLRAVLAFAGLSLAITAHGGPPTKFPNFKDQQTSQFFVVADLSKGTSLPLVTPECPEDKVCINLNPPPFWFEVKVIATIHGKDAPANFYGVTGSHWGAVGYGSGKPVLAKFETNGSEYVLLRYAKQDLVERKDGTFYLVVYSDYKIHWLPCSVSTLREEISPDDFVGNLKIAFEDFGRYRVDDNPAFFRMTAAGTVPRYGISIARLQAHLSELSLGQKKLSCE